MTDVLAVADKFEPALLQAINTAFADARDGVDLAALEAALESGDAEGASASLQISNGTLRGLESALEAGFDPTISAAFVAAAVATISTLRGSVTLPSADIYIAEYQVGMRGQFVLETRQAMEQSVARASRNRIASSTAYQHARHIRKSIGLTITQAKAVDNFRDQLTTKSNKPDGRSLTPAAMRRLNAAEMARVRKHLKKGHLTTAEVDDMVDRYRQRLMNHRALTIARTEGARAANAGQQSAWIRAADEGVIDSEVRRIWITAGDERVRDSHRRIPAMNKSGVGLAEPFRTPSGLLMYPPAGINCRCRIALRGAA